MSAHYTRMMAEAGCVGVLTTNSSPSMAPWGGRAKTVGANPWSVATPAGAHGVAVLDISNGNVARGRYIRNPEHRLAVALSRRLERRGIEVAGGPGAGHPPGHLQPIARVRSALAVIP
jgi:LDH2 family malate/lactate/ureidoglycolate dehydrogenase